MINWLLKVVHNPEGKKLEAKPLVATPALSTALKNKLRRLRPQPLRTRGTKL